ncbi:NAD-dependent protein deacetylase sirtuin-2-like [Porites lutea]|uniref:NAD-dependent protein deacetylase sirtuin-2-like n=1 Tax=Porites lutea TaxID=51062 RepID=UPI003CC60EBA
MASKEDKPPSESQDEGSIGDSGEHQRDEKNQDNSSAEASGGEPKDGISLNALQKFLQSLQISAGIGVKNGEANEEEKEKPVQLLDEVTFEGIAKFIRSGRCSKIIVMTGAGISTAAGIPDFRSPGTGLYDNLQKYDLPTPQAVFEINFFRSNPAPFFTLAKELYPGKFQPTISHYFIKLLSDKGLLQRNYTQNIDTLERVAGIPQEKIIEAHGSFHTAHCVGCRKEYPHEWIRDEVFADRIPYCSKCEGVVKPDIVFFGESLPERFHKHVTKDMSKCDLLIVMGTSLVVQPFASLVDRVPETTPRLLINKEKSGQQVDFFTLLMGGKSGFQFDSEDNYRDVMWQGTTDDGCVALADLLGWKDELLKLVETAHKKIDSASRDANDQHTTAKKLVGKDSVEKQGTAAENAASPKRTLPKSKSPAGTSSNERASKGSTPKEASGKSTSPAGPSVKGSKSKQSP